MRWPALLLLPLLLGCTGGAPGTDDQEDPGIPNNPAPPAPAPPQGTITTNSMVPRTATPPVGVTWHVGITENVPLSWMQALFASFVAASNAMYRISEGQVYLHTVKFFDSVGPGISAGTYIQTNTGINTTNLDLVVWPANMWNIPFSGAVGAQQGQGRNNRIMILPDNAQPFVLLHESGHMLFQLSWAPGPLLVDEYQDGVQDPACVMESQNLPQRWCAQNNHNNQISQPRSCWGQILIDYPGFRHTGADWTNDLPPTLKAEYNDTP